MRFRSGSITTTTEKCSGMAAMKSTWRLFPGCDIPLDTGTGFGSPGGRKILPLYTGMPIWNVFFTDLTGDGLPGIMFYADHRFRHRR